MGLLTNLGFAYQFMQHGVALKFVVFGLFSSLLKSFVSSSFITKLYTCNCSFEELSACGICQGFSACGFNSMFVSTGGIAGLLNSFFACG